MAFRFFRYCRYYLGRCQREIGQAHCFGWKSGLDQFGNIVALSITASNHIAQALGVSYIELFAPDDQSLGEMSTD
jgi:hypothetical protein